MERKTRFELATFTLARWRSTTEPLPQMQPYIKRRKRPSISVLLHYTNFCLICQYLNWNLCINFRHFICCSDYSGCCSDWSDCFCSGCCSGCFCFDCCSDYCSGSTLKSPPCFLNILWTAKQKFIQKNKNVFLYKFYNIYAKTVYIFF